MGRSSLPARAVPHAVWYALAIALVSGGWLVVMTLCDEKERDRHSEYRPSNTGSGRDIHGVAELQPVGVE
jgi:hypothetical protein